MSFNLCSNVKHWWSKLASFPGLCRFRLHEEWFYILQVTKTSAGPGDEARLSWAGQMLEVYSRCVSSVPGAVPQEIDTMASQTKWKLLLIRSYWCYCEIHQAFKNYEVRLTGLFLWSSDQCYYNLVWKLATLSYVATLHHSHLKHWKMLY